MGPLLRPSIMRCARHVAKHGEHRAQFWAMAWPAVFNETGLASSSVESQGRYCGNNSAVCRQRVREGEETNPMTTETDISPSPV